MDFHFIITQSNGDIRIVQVIIHEVFLDHIAFVPQANDKVIMTVLAIRFKDVPDNGFTPYFDHWFGPNFGFLADSCS